MESKKLLLVYVGVALLFLILGCTKPDFRTINDPVMSTGQMQSELERLHEINLTVGSDDFDPNDYPVSVGIDIRNGKILVEKFICWDGCPEVGMVFLLYERVDTVQACIDSVFGSPLMSPEPIPGDYWGCRPVVDWLNTPGRFTG